MEKRIKYKDRVMKISRYINPFTDFGFKTLFGQEANKDLLIDFLNEVLQLPDKITDVTYLNSENIGLTEDDRTAVFDVYCKTQNNEYCIIEMQQVSQQNYLERCIYYSTFAIKQQITKGAKLWIGEKKKLKSYVISILNFNLKELENDDEVLSSLSLFNRRLKTEVYDSVMLVFLVMPKFKKNINELETHFDKWLYVLSQLPKLDRMPDKLKSSIFDKVFSVAEVANLSEEASDDYILSTFKYEDENEIFDEGKALGKEEGIALERKKTILALAKKGFEASEISNTLQIDISEVLKVLK